MRMLYGGWCGLNLLEEHVGSVIIILIHASM